jgi:5'-nucleotidase
LKAILDILFKISDVTYGDLVATVPFENHLHVVEIRGDYLLSVLEQGASKVKKIDEGDLSLHHLLQTSGLRVEYNLTNPVNERVILVLALRSTEGTPTYEPLNPFRFYRVATTSWLAEGKGGYQTFKDKGHNLIVGPLDIDAISEYFERRTVVKQNLDERLKFVF